MTLQFKIGLQRDTIKALFETVQYLASGQQKDYRVHFIKHSETFHFLIKFISNNVPLIMLLKQKDYFS